jgi:NAD(P)H-dependent FMN reductase
VAKLLLISGSLRGGSTNSGTLRTAAALAPAGIKNLLDWTVGGGQMSGMPVAWINVSGAAAPSGRADAHDSLRKVLGYTGAEIVEEACLRLPLARGDVGEDGLIAPKESSRAAIVGALSRLAAAAQ